MSLGRLDRYLVDQGLVSSRQKAQELITRGDVTVAGRTVMKSSYAVSDGDVVEVADVSIDVGRGATKLRSALDHFGVDVSGRVAVDVGASTGGFTQVLLERGVSQVVALDVGHGQLHPSLARDPRVVSLEGENIVEMTRERWGAVGSPGVDLVVCDVSFISLTTVIPVCQDLWGDRASWVLLVKPQFEVGRGKTRQGIVVDQDAREQALETVLGTCRSAGRQDASWMESPVVGKKGNREFLVYSPGATHPPHQ